MRISVKVAPVLATLLQAGCGGDEAVSTTPPWTVADSAGVTIVENEDRTSPGGGRFTLSAEPVLSIGSMADDPEYQLFQVAGGTRLADGRIVLVNRGSQELRVYGADGTFSHAFGAAGSGPGEYESPRLVGRLPGDSLLVYDTSHRRLSVVQVDAGWARSFPMPQEAGGFPVPQGAFSDGTQVYGGGLYFSSADGGFPTGTFQNDSQYASVDRSGSPVTELGAWPSFQMYGKVTESGSFSARSLPFGWGTSVAVGPNRLYLARGDRYEVRAHRPDGSLDRIIRLDRERPPVTDADVEQYVADELEDADSPNERRQFESLMTELPVPDRMPALSNMIVDALGNLWVQNYTGPRTRNPEWTVFDREGRIRGTVRTPDRTQVLEIGQDYLLGRVSDELDVEYVRLWSLDRPSY